MSELIGAVLNDKYVLTRLLGEGGMGVVYEGKHTLVGKRVAVKLLHPQFAEREDVVTRFHHEAQAAAAIGHENIADVIDMGKTASGEPYLVMEYLDGMDLKHLLLESGRLPWSSIAHIMVQVLEALQAAHAAGIIHRDLKPENIFLIQTRDNPQYVKVLDFGISKFNSLDDGASTGLTQTGMIMGTPNYMSPEQAAGQKDIDRRTDIYAMGVILYEMCTQALPFIASTYNALIIKIFTEAPTDPLTVNPDLPADLADIINTAMARDPGDRFPDCASFRERLIPYLAAEEGSIARNSAAARESQRPSGQPAPTPMDMVNTRPGRRTKSWVLPLVIVLAVIGIGGVLWGILSGDGAGDEPSVAARAAAAEKTASRPQDVRPAKAATERPTGAAAVSASGAPATGIGPCTKVREKRGPNAGGCAGQLPTEHMQWVSMHRPMFVDINGDGTHELLGWVRFIDISNGSAFDHLAAFDVATGERLWKSDPLVDMSNIVNVRFAVVENRLLVVDAAGSVKSFSVEKGQLVWSSMLGERADRICKDVPGSARIETTDERVVRVALSTGQITPLGQVDPDNRCESLQGESAPNDGFIIGGGTWNENGLFNPRIQGMDVDRVILEKKGRRAVAVGQKSPGTAVPMAARYNPGPVTKKSRDVDPQWLTILPSVAPLTVKEEAPVAVAISNGVFLAVYDLQNSDDGSRLAAIDLASGEKRWDVFIPSSGTQGAEHIFVKDGRVFLPHWTYMNIFDLETGRHQMTIGIW